MAVRVAPVDRRDVGALRAGAGLEGLFPPIIGVLAVAGLVELTLMRTFYRVGVFLPKEGGFRSVYAALTDVGSFAFNLATVLALAGLGVLVVVAAQRRRTAVAASAGVFLVVGLMAAAGGSGVRPVVRVGFVLSVVAVAWPMLRRRGPAGGRILVGAVAAAVLASSYAGFTADAQILAPGGVASAGVVAAQLTGEALVVAAALAAAAAPSRVPGDGAPWRRAWWRRWRSRPPGRQTDRSRESSCSGRRGCGCTSPCGSTRSPSGAPWRRRPGGVGPRRGGPPAWSSSWWGGSSSSPRISRRSSSSPSSC